MVAAAASAAVPPAASMAAPASEACTLSAATAYWANVGPSAERDSTGQSALASASKRESQVKAGGTAREQNSECTSRPGRRFMTGAKLTIAPLASARRERAWVRASAWYGHGQTPEVLEGRRTRQT